MKLCTLHCNAKLEYVLYEIIYFAATDQFVLNCAISHIFTSAHTCVIIAAKLVLRGFWSRTVKSSRRRGRWPWMSFSSRPAGAGGAAAVDDDDAARCHRSCSCSSSGDFFGHERCLPLHCYRAIKHDDTKDWKQERGGRKNKRRS